MISAVASLFGSSSGDGDRSPPLRRKVERPLTPDPPSESSDEEEAPPTPPPGTPGTLRNRHAKVTAAEANAAVQSFRPAHQCSQCRKLNFLCLWTVDTASQGHAKCGRCRARKKPCDLSVLDPAGGFVAPPQHQHQPPRHALPGLGMMPVRDSDCPPRAAGWSQARVDVTPNFRGRDRGRRPPRQERSQSPTPDRHQPVRERGELGRVSGWTPINAAPEVADSEGAGEEEEERNPNDAEEGEWWD